MSNLQAYQKYLASANLTESDVSPALDATEKNSLFAAVMGILISSDPPEDISKFILEGLENINVSTNQILSKLNKEIVEKYSLPEPAFVGAYPTQFFDGQTVFGEAGPLILVNNGALQLIGGAVQLMYSRHGPLRKAQELRQMVIKYTSDFQVPKNSEFMGSWADFDHSRYQEMVVVGTTAEIFLILHEYGHVSLQIKEHIADEELRADNWALQKIIDEAKTFDLPSVGPFIFLGLCYFLEALTQGSNNSSAQTHPGAALRIAQAALKLAPHMSVKTTRIALEFLMLVDSALAITLPTGYVKASKILEIANTLQTIFPKKLLDFINGIDLANTLQALVDTALDESKEGDSNAKDRMALDSPPPGIRLSDDPNVFIYELPSGEPLEMVLVEKGEFLQGPRVLPGYPSVDELDEVKGRAVSASTTCDFYIGRYPVLWYQYESFCRLRSRDLPQTPSWTPLSNQPVVNITLADAEAFCYWAELELPSEKEWEKAARGRDGRLFPWGETPPSEDSLVRKSPRAAVPDLTTTSPYGAENMVGGVWEITADWLEAKRPMEAGRYRVLRGASYRSDPQAATVLSRHRVMPNFPYEDIGFRVILKVVPETSEDWITDVLNEKQSKPTFKGISLHELSPSEQEAAHLLFQACNDSLSAKSLGIVQYIVNAYPKCVSWLDADGYTPLLRVTAKLPYFETPFLIASVLIDAGADVNAQTPGGSTSLHMLACQPQYYALEIAHLILQCGGDPTIMDNRGFTPEMVARRFQAMGAGDGFLALLKR